MKGLLTKDLMIMRSQRKTLAVILFIGIVMAVTNEPGAVIAFFPIISGMLALGTLSYDEMDHSCSYLLTLPASRKAYVKEKYLFSFAVVILAMVIGIAACIVIMMLSSEPPVIYGNEIIVTAGAIFAFVMLLFAVEIPLRLKFGIEKGRIAMYVLYGILAVSAVLISKYFPEETLPELETLLRSKGFAVLVAAVAASLILFYCSSVLSQKIMEDKEF